MALDYLNSLTFLNGSIIMMVEIAIVLALTVIIAKTVSMLLSRSYKEMSRSIKIDRTQFLVLRRLVVLAVYVFGIIISGSMIPGLSTLGVSLLASAGIIAVIVGFAAQQTFSNIIAGVFIAIFEPFRVGDKISIKDEYGTVEDITLRHTVVRTWEEKRIIIPNSKMGEEFIINYSIKDPKMLGVLNIGISYDSDIDKARKIMTEEALKHPDLKKDVRGKDNAFLSKEELVKVRLTELTDFAQNMRLYFWAPDKTTAIGMKFDLIEAIKKRFDKEGVEIPFPYRTIVYKKDLK